MLRQEQEGLPEAWGGAGRKSEQLVAAPPSWEPGLIPGGEGVACSPFSQSDLQTKDVTSFLFPLWTPLLQPPGLQLCPIWTEEMGSGSGAKSLDCHFLWPWLFWTGSGGRGWGLL